MGQRKVVGKREEVILRRECACGSITERKCLLTEEQISKYDDIGVEANVTVLNVKQSCRGCIDDMHEEHVFSNEDKYEARLQMVC